MTTQTHFLTAPVLRELIAYNPETGALTALASRRGMRKKNAELGCTDSYGYRVLSVASKTYKAHRLVWLHVHGEWPIGQIDHINGNKSDNRLANLRDVPQAMNLQNMVKAKKNNKSTGLLGVSTNSERAGYRNPFRAQIRVNGKLKALGNFPDADTAHQAYLAAKSQVHDGFLASSQQKR